MEGQSWERLAPGKMASPDLVPVHHSIGQMCIWYLSLTWQRPLSLVDTRDTTKREPTAEEGQTLATQKPQSGKSKLWSPEQPACGGARQMSQPLSLV